MTLARLNCLNWGTLMLVGALAGEASAQLVGLSSSNPGRLYTISPATGTATPGSTVTGIQEFSAVGLEFLNGTLYATDAFVDSGGGGSARFGTINLATGAFSEINSQGGAINWHGLAGDPDANLLYTVNLDNAAFPLLSITPAGVITPIGNTNVNLRGLAYDNENNILYAVDLATALYTVNTATGAATLVGPTGISSLSTGLAYDPATDQLLLNDGINHNLYRLNTSTGAATLLGANGTTVNIDGLAVVPEPSAAALALVAVGGCISRRRCRRRM